MLRKFWAISALAVVSLVFVLGSVEEVRAAPISPGDIVSLANGDSYVASEAAGAGAINDTYTFNIASPVNVSMKVNFILGTIENLKFSWAPEGSFIDVTDGTGALTGVDSLFISGLAGPSQVLTVTGNVVGSTGAYTVTVSAVPLPAAGVLFLSALAAAGLLRRRKMIKEFGLPA